VGKVPAWNPRIPANQPIFEDRNFYAGFDNILLHRLPRGIACFGHLCHLLQQFLASVNQLHSLIVKTMRRRSNSFEITGWLQHKQAHREGRKKHVPSGI